MSTGRLPSVDGGIQPTIVDAKGDLIVATAADTVSRLAVGSNDQVLTADSSTATGLKWAAAASGGANWSIVNSGGTSLSGAATVTVSGISGADKLMVLILASTGASGSEIRIRFNADSGNNYYSFGAVLEGTASYTVDQFKINNGAADSGILLARNATAAVYCAGYVLLTGGNSSGIKSYSNVGAASLVTGTSRDYFTGGYYNSSSTISSVSAISSAGDFDDGTIYVYKSA